MSPQAREHPTEKPVALLFDIISAVPGNVILDPFMGAGSVGVAAVSAGRAFIGCDINPHHYETALRRIERAYAQPRLFVEPVARPQQIAMEYDPAENSRRGYEVYCDTMAAELAERRLSEPGATGADVVREKEAGRG